MIVARLLADRAGLAAAAESLKEHTEALAAARRRRAVGRVHERLARSGRRRGSRPSRTSTSCSSPRRPALLDDPDLGDLLRTAPCDVAVVTGGEPAPGPVLVPFAGTDHDWSAIELGAWLAGSWQVPLRLAGPGGRGRPGREPPAGERLARRSARAGRCGGAAPRRAGPGALVAAAADAGVAVVGLSDRWRKDGLGPTRARSPAAARPTLLVRKGLRPGGLAPAENLTRFTWSLSG